MKNLLPYLKFIEECKNKEAIEGFHIHHIIPKFMGGDDEETNLVKLSYFDHQKAHLILANCYPKKSFEWRGNINSANILQLQVSNPDFDISGENHPRYGETWSEEAKERIRDSVNLYYKLHPEHGKEKVKNRDLSGEKNPMYGKGYKVAGEKNGRYGGKGTTDETRKKISIGNSGKVKTVEMREKMSINSTGEKNGMYGRSAYSIWIEKYGLDEANRRREESRIKIKNSAKGKPKSEETKEKMRQSALNRRKEKT